MKAAKRRKSEVVTPGRFSIRKRNGKWQVDYRKIGGKQVSYETKLIAQAQADIEWKDKGPSVIVQCLRDKRQILVCRNYEPPDTGVFVPARSKTGLAIIAKLLADLKHGLDRPRS